MRTQACAALFGIWLRAPPANAPFAVCSREQLDYQPQPGHPHGRVLCAARVARAARCVMTNARRANTSQCPVLATTSYATTLWTVRARRLLCCSCNCPGADAHSLATQTLSSSTCPGAAAGMRGSDTLCMYPQRGRGLERRRVEYRNNEGRLPARRVRVHVGCSLARIHRR